MKRFRGQGLVEFALILPVLLLILLGIIEAALVFQGYLAVQHAAREAARFAVTYQPVAGQKLDGTACDFTVPQGPPFVNPGWVCNAREPASAAGMSEYYARRVALIKQRALESAAGLRINRNFIGITPATFELYKDQPGFFGVLVWGYPSFETDCNANPNQCLDHPGLEGLPVRVYVRHNVEIIDPFYRLIARYVTVDAQAEMINEGIQVGFGKVPPPRFRFNPNPDIGTPVPPTATPPGWVPPTVAPTATPTPLPFYSITLFASPENQQQVTNEMPASRCHDFVATVSYQGSPVRNAWVSFFTNRGSFTFAGTGGGYIEALTDATGKARVTLCGNEPGTATIRAWIDSGGDDLWTGEISALAYKTWRFAADTPYITVADHEVVALDTDFADVMDHAAGQYGLYWCVISGTNTSTLLTVVTVGPTRNAEDVEFTVPNYSEGLYRLETHPSGGGGCGAADLVAYSAEIRAIPALTDLVISSFSLPSRICPRTTFTMTAVVGNISVGSTERVFDVDFYLDPVSAPPQSPIGVMKQWVSGITREGSVEVTTLMWAGPGTHVLWARADTSDYVMEENEENNASSISFTTGATATTTSSWYSPSANAADVSVPSGDNDGFERNPTYAYADDSRYAESRDTGTSGTCRDRHRYYNYNISVPSNAAIAGIEVRADWWLDSTSGNNSLGVELSWDGGTTWTAAKVDTVESTSQRTVILGGPADTWGRTWSPGDFSNANFRVRVSAITDNNARDFYLDWIAVRLTFAPVCTAGNDQPPWGSEGTIKPPGLQECTQLLRARGFEGNADNVFAYWRAGEAGAFRRQSTFFYEGTLSMRLHTTLGSYPSCTPVANPYLYQPITIPTDVYTQTTLVVRGYRLVAESESACCYTVTDPNDVLYLQMRNSAGVPLAPGNGLQVVHGGVLTRTWAPFELDVTSVVSPYGRTRAGPAVVWVYFHGVQNVDENCTFFYLDALESNLCTYWPIPPDVPGTASFGGLIRVLIQGIPRSFQGVRVWAYSPGGRIYRTVTIQDGTYHFYNIPPGTYTVYAEYWESGVLRYGTWSVTVSADERNYSVNLYLS